MLSKLYNFILKNNFQKYYYDTQIIKEALGAHMRPYGYTYCTPSWDGVLHGKDLGVMAVGKDLGHGT